MPDMMPGCVLSGERSPFALTAKEPVTEGRTAITEAQQQGTDNRNPGE